VTTPRRVVSLVPSLTESIAATAAEILVGATDWCTHPPGLDVARIGGTKNPRLDDIVALRPDLVVANQEENRAPDIAALRDSGLDVLVTAPTTVAGALVELADMLAACGLGRPRWLEDAERAWRRAASGRRITAAIPIWRRPWMVLGRDTFAGDVLSRLDIDNVFAGDDDRYPKVTLDAIKAREPDLVVLPDEPYAFGWDDGPEAFAGWSIPVACVSGRHLTWYGPSLAEARDVLLAQLAAARLA
jgi:ABC-type Fe3+-hydroxamate transport system substrate-binding protein